MQPPKRGRPAGKTYGQVKTILFSEADQERLKRLADLRRTSEAAVVRQLILEESERREIRVEETASEERRPTRGPRNTSERELARVGVRIVDPNRFCLECVECGARWSPDFPAGGSRFHRGYWRCMNGCNDPDR